MEDDLKRIVTTVLGTIIFCVLGALRDRRSRPGE